MASVGIAQTNTTGVDFIINNLQATVTANVGANTNAVNALPTLLALEPMTAAVACGRQKGGPVYHGAPNAVWPSNSTGVIQITNFEASAAVLPYTKNGCLMVLCTGTTPVTISLTNTQINTNGFWGDTTFANANVIMFKNVSGAGDNGAIASMSINGSGTNGFKMGMATNSQITLDGAGSIWFSQTTNGFAVNAANANITITPTNAGTLAMYIGGN